MTSLRTLVTSLIGASVILVIGLGLLVLSPTFGSYFVIGALAIAAWAFGAYRQNKWAWRVAVCFSYALVTLVVVVILVFPVRFIIDFHPGSDTFVAMVAVVVFASIALAGTIVSFRRSLWHLYEERAQFFRELPSNPTVEGDARKSSARPSP